MPASLDGSASAFPIDRRGCFSQPFLTCCFARKGDLCLPRFGAAVPNGCPPSHEVALSAAQSLFRMGSMKWHSIVKWYRILRVHYHWSVFQRIWYALWLAR